MIQLIVWIMAVLIVGSAVPAFPHGGNWRGGVNIEVVSDSGSSLPLISHRDLWQGKTKVIKKYLEARKNENYGIVVHNGTPERVGVVIAVDGRNIITGERSDLRNNEAMYILNGHEQGRYDGWRTSRDEVHRFFFTESARSYTMRTFSDSSAMGVIAVAVFREKDRPRPLGSMNQDAAPAAPHAAGPSHGPEKAQADRSAGTGFGDSSYSPVVNVEFRSESIPVQKMLVKYEWREELCRKGLVRCEQEPQNRLWDEGRYAPYPPAK